MDERPPRYTFDAVQHVGARNVAEVARDLGARLVHVSAIGADAQSAIPYARTKGLGDDAVMSLCGANAIIIRPRYALKRQLRTHYRDD